MTIEQVKTTSELLRRYAAGERDFPGIDLESRVERDISLEGADLKGINLTGANLARCPLSGVNFSGANLQDVCFQISSIRGANFEGSNLRNASFARDKGPRAREGLGLARLVLGSRASDFGV